MGVRSRMRAQGTGHGTTAVIATSELTVAIPRTTNGWS